MEEQTKKLVGVVSLGCDKNRVDTENMMTLLKEAGYGFTADPAEADIIVINTCAFISQARKESEDTIAEMLAVKQNGKTKCLVVSGCYPQNRMKDLLLNYPDVDIFIGTNEYKSLPKMLSEFFKKGEKIHKNDSPAVVDCIEEGRLITTMPHTAYIKIADGCDNFCSYCTIPFIRGRYRSRVKESILAEARDLVKSGAKELILVAQDITRYGSDLYGKNSLPELLHDLSKIEDLKWIRLLYCYPENVDDDLIYEIKTNDKVCKYIDIPLQHISDPVLKAMNRKVTRAQIELLIKKLRDEIPQITIRSTFMVGFPGETKEQFAELIGFLKEFKLENVGFFMYSKEEGTVAGRMENQVSEITKRKRLLKAAMTQKKVANANIKKLRGTKQTVLYEGIDYDKGMFYGRTEAQSPEIDGITYFTSPNMPVDVGNFYTVKITKTNGYDLIGVVTE